MNFQTTITTPRRRRASRAALIALAAAFAPCGTLVAQDDATEDYLPEKYRPSKYINTFNNSPFSREILPPAEDSPVEPPPPFDFKLVGVQRLGENYRITLVDKKGQYLAVTEKPNADGYYYADIKPSPKIQDVEVQIVNGAQKEWVEFDTKRFLVASKGVAPTTPQNNNARPNVVPSRPSSPPQRGGPRSSPVPKSPAAAAQDQRAGGAAASAIQQANQAAKSRASTRKVVLPPPSRR